MKPGKAGRHLGGSSWQKAPETAGAPGLCGQVLSPRGRFLGQVVAPPSTSGIGSIGDRLPTAYDLLSSADNTLQLGAGARDGPAD